MNYLAHLYLSGNDKELLIGNFLGDSVKGSKFEKYSEGVQKGIRLHRAIDSYTDAHPIFKITKSRLKPFDPYAGVIVDMFYDHLLAANWQQYSDVSLMDYTQWAYSILHSRIHKYPEKAKKVLPAMSKYNWLFGYGMMEGLERSLYGISKRTVNNFALAPAVKLLEENRADFENDFKLFFEDLRGFCQEEINK
jgi:acyl carrier protein phosphodiesterase